MIGCGAVCVCVCLGAPSAARLSTPTAQLPVLGEPLGDAMTRLAIACIGDAHHRSPHERRTHSAAMNYLYFWFHVNYWLEVCGLRPSFDERYPAQHQQQGQQQGEEGTRRPGLPILCAPLSTARPSICLSSSPGPARPPSNLRWLTPSSRRPQLLLRRGQGLQLPRRWLGGAAGGRPSLPSGATALGRREDARRPRRAQAHEGRPLAHAARCARRQRRDRGVAAAIGADRGRRGGGGGSCEDSGAASRSSGFSGAKAAEGDDEAGGDCRPPRPRVRPTVLRCMRGLWLRAPQSGRGHCRAG